MTDSPVPVSAPIENAESAMGFETLFDTEWLSLNGPSLITPGRSIDFLLPGLIYEVELLKDYALIRSRNGARRSRANRRICQAYDVFFRWRKYQMQDGSFASFEDDDCFVALNDAGEAIRRSRNRRIRTEMV